MEAVPGLEPGLHVLQTCALSHLGHTARVRQEGLEPPTFWFSGHP
jgi:hypothetical protein